MKRFVLFQVLHLNCSRERAQQEVKEKEEEKRQMKEGLKVALDEMTKLKVLLQVQHLLLDTNRSTPDK